ncbi:Csu type fimbrial protein [Aureimonas populi]|uniref:Spore coat U domain-containing protein n=1 Tax=Aureimonas populi TaxID=1701758 RepID=A0ABW5CT95_9HYPH|nr:spore coat U domain-containing protein [Aureimonas populi]
MNDNLNVSLTVESSCTITAGALAFGPYVATADSQGSADLSVNCTPGTQYHVSLAATTDGTRTLTSGTNTLSYSLYSDAGFSSLFSEDPNGTKVEAAAAAETITVYGRVPAAQSAVVGNYTDTVTVTLTY